MPELGEQDAVKLAGAAVMTTGALWPHTQPSAAMLAAYEADPELAARHVADLSLFAHQRHASNPWCGGRFRFPGRFFAIASRGA